MRCVLGYRAVRRLSDIAVYNPAFDYPARLVSHHHRTGRCARSYPETLAELRD